MAVELDDYLKLWKVKAYGPEPVNPMRSRVKLSEYIEFVETKKMRFDAFVLMNIRSVRVINGTRRVSYLDQLTERMYSLAKLIRELIRSPTPLQLLTG